MNALTCHTMDFEFFLQEHGIRLKYGTSLVTIFYFEKGKLKSSLQGGLTEIESKSQKPINNRFFNNISDI